MIECSISAVLSWLDTARKICHKSVLTGQAVSWYGLYVHRQCFIQWPYGAITAVNFTVWKTAHYKRALFFILNSLILTAKPTHFYVTCCFVV